MNPALMRSASGMVLSKAGKSHYVNNATFILFTRIPF